MAGEVNNKNEDQSQSEEKKPFVMNIKHEKIFYRDGTFDILITIGDAQARISLHENYLDKVRSNTNERNAEKLKSPQ